MDWREILDRTSKALFKGVLDALFVVVLYFIGLPLLMKLVLGPYSEYLPVEEEPFLVGAFIIIGLSAAARGLEGYILSPVLRSASHFFAFIIAAWSIGSTRIELLGIEVGEAIVGVSLDVAPLLASVVVFLLMPGVILPMIDYFLERE